MSTFFERIARNAVRSAPADLNSNPDGDDTDQGQRNEPQVLPEPDEPCPSWILRRARGEVDEDDPRAVARAPDWPEDLLELVARLTGETGDRLEAADLPASPFRLQSCVTITDGRRWLEDVRREVVKGTRCTRARLGTLQQDIRFLVGAMARHDRSGG